MLSLYLNKTNALDIKNKKNKKEKKVKVVRAQTISPTPLAIEISTPGKSSRDLPPPPLLALEGLSLRE